MDNTEFMTKSSAEKIEEIISRIKKSVLEGQDIAPVFYLFDENSRMHVIEIKDNSLLKKNRRGVVTQLVREKIREMNARNLGIEKVLFLREGYYNPQHPNKNSMDLDDGFNKHNGNEALIVTVEDEYNFNLRVYDVIVIHDDGRKFSVLSENPIEEMEFCKIDPECNVRTNYLNLL